MMDVRSLLEEHPKQMDFVTPDCSASKALNILSSPGADAVLVIEDQSLVGIITKHDFLNRFLVKGEKDVEKTKSMQLMSPNPTTISPTCSLEKALEIFTSNSYHCLPVVENGKFLGCFITLEQVVKAIINTHDSLLGYSLDTRKIGDISLKNRNFNDKIYSSLIEKVTKLTEDFHEDLVSNVCKEVEQMKTIFEEDPINLSNQKILLCAPPSKSFRVTKMSLQSTGAFIEYAEDMDSGERMIHSKNFSTVIVDKQMLSLSAIARDKDPKTKIVLLTSDSPDEYIPKLRPYPYVNNIVSLSKDDYKFAVKGVLSTIKKITSGDIFGIEKYLEQGTKVLSEPIEGSENRGSAIKSMRAHFSKVGLTKSLISRIAMVAEELLLNSIYDAPVDLDGNPLYNSLDRRVAVKLQKHQQATLTYGSDGSFAGIAAIDPFGSIKKNTVFRYLQSCYSDQAGTLDNSKGGAGRGLFMIVEGADLIVFNVKPGTRTEVAAFFAIDKKEAQKIGRSSFHYFLEND